MLPVAFYSSKGEGKEAWGFFNMLGIFHHSWNRGKSTHWYGPWYSHSDSTLDSVTRNLVPLFFYSNETEDGKERGYFNMLGIFHHSWAPEKPQTGMGCIIRRQMKKTVSKPAYSSAVLFME